MLRFRLRGFTLLELIVVIVILAVLAALTIPTFGRAVKRTHLESAEVTVSSVAREVVALSKLDQTLVRTDHINAVVGDLGAYSDGIWASAPMEVTTGLWEFSGSERVLSASLGGSPLGSEVGFSLAVPGAGCAYAKGVGGTVTSWHVLDAPVTSCSGAAAFLDPDEVLKLTAPPTPSGLRLTFGSCVLPSGWDVSWAGGPADIYVNGKWVGSFDAAACVPGVETDVVTVIKRPAGASEGSPGGWDGGVGDVLGDGVVVLPPGEGPVTPVDPGEVASSNPVSSPSGWVLLSWSSSLPEGTSDLTLEVKNITGGKSTIPLSMADASVAAGKFYYNPGSGTYSYALKAGRGSDPLQFVPVKAETVTAPALQFQGGSGSQPLSAQTVGTSVTLSWLPVGESETAPLGGYRVRVSSAGWGVTEVGKASTSLILSGLSVGQHCFTLTAYGLGGESPQSDPLCVTVTSTTNFSNIVWHQQPNQTLAERGTAIAVVSDTAVYFSGGTDRPASLNPAGRTTVKRYSPATGSQSVVATLPKGRMEHSMAVDGDGRIYVAAGKEDQTYSGSVIMFDPVASRWSTLPSLPAWTSGSEHLVVAADGTLYYLRSDKILTLKSGAPSWSELPLPFATSSNSALSMDKNGVLHVVSGARYGTYKVQGGGWSEGPGLTLPVGSGQPRMYFNEFNEPVLIYGRSARTVFVLKDASGSWVGSVYPAPSGTNGNVVAEFMTPNNKLYLSGVYDNDSVLGRLWIS